MQHSHLRFNFHEFLGFLKFFQIKWFQLCVFRSSTYEQKLCYTEIKPTPSLESAPNWEFFCFIISRINSFGSIMTQLYPYVYNFAISSSILKQIESTCTIIKCVSRFVKHNAIYLQNDVRRMALPALINVVQFMESRYQFSNCSSLALFMVGKQYPLPLSIFLVLPGSLRSLNVQS